MDPIHYIDRLTGKEEIEKVYGAAALKLLYGDDWLSKLLGAPLLALTAKLPLFSAWYGFWQHSTFSKSKILPFIRNYHIDVSEFLEPLESFQSFNDFFIRKLKAESRPIAPGNHVATIPADGRYRFFPNIAEADGFVVKGKKFNLASLLQDSDLAKRYEKGTMVMARLCPTDYHRFHFPVACAADETKMINGYLYSVNPIAVKRNIQIFTENKRALTELHTEAFGNILFLEVGATNVGSIVQTFTPFKNYPKAAEKGFFEFGASALILLFEPGRITLDADLVNKNGLEIKCLMGQSMGIVPST